jgi:hypothetical protein
LTDDLTKQRVKVASLHVVVSFLHPSPCCGRLAPQRRDVPRSSFPAIARPRGCYADRHRRLDMRLYEKGCVEMTSHALSAKTAHSAAPSASRFGFWTAVCMSIATAAALAVAIMTPPRSGPFCVSSCVTYPYTDIAAFFPRDYLWMYPGMLLAPLFVVLMACIHHYASNDKKLFSLIGLSFAAVAAAVITTDYFIQLTVIQPSLLQGETAGLSLISQYNPHGIFIALESLGYVLMSVAFVFAAAVFGKRERVERVLRWLFISGFILAVGSLIVLSLLYGNNLEYRFEVVVILIDWLALIVSGGLLSVVFKRAGRDGSTSATQVSKSR